MVATPVREAVQRHSEPTSHASSLEHTHAPDTTSQVSPVERPLLPVLPTVRLASLQALLADVRCRPAGVSG